MHYFILPLLFALIADTPPEFVPPQPLVVCYMNEAPHEWQCVLAHGLDRSIMVIA